MSWLDGQWQRLGPWHVLLLPLALVFRLVAAARRAWYRHVPGAARRLPVPVVVVGNISVGGTGKTPLVLWLAEALSARGHSPGIVSRGYGGTGRAPRPATADASAADVGDEPLLMARRGVCPVWVGRDRVAAAHALLAAHPRCSVVLCDDGLQHYRLARDVEIAVVDAARGFGNGLPLPAGPLREPAARLRQVDAVVLNGGGAPPAEPCFTMRLEGTRFLAVADSRRSATADELRGRRLLAVAGIGNPRRFFDHLARLGLACECRAFPDHHAFTAADFAFAAGATVLMTEKDAVKCGALGLPDAWYLPVQAQVGPGLLELVLERLASRPGR